MAPLAIEKISHAYSYPIQDAWERPLLYVNPGTWNKKGFDIWSQGRDGIDQLDPNDTAFDDVTNWQVDL